MMTIALHQLRFHAYHGLYPEEIRTGNEFELDLEADFRPEVFIIEKLSDTLNYVAVYEWVKKNMEVPTPLLETLVMKIAVGLSDQYPEITEIRISLRKLTAPIAGMNGQVGVKFVWNK